MKTTEIYHVQIAEVSRLNKLLKSLSGRIQDLENEKSKSNSDENGVIHKKHSSDPSNKEKTNPSHTKEHELEKNVNSSDEKKVEEAEKNEKDSKEEKKEEGTEVEEEVKKNKENTENE